MNQVLLIVNPISGRGMVGKYLLDIIDTFSNILNSIFENQIMKLKMKNMEYFPKIKQKIFCKLI